MIFFALFFVIGLTVQVFAQDSNVVCPPGMTFKRSNGICEKKEVNKQAPQNITCPPEMFFNRSIGICVTEKATLSNIHNLLDSDAIRLPIVSGTKPFSNPTTSGIRSVLDVHTESLKGQEVVPEKMVKNIERRIENADEIKSKLSEMANKDPEITEKIRATIGRIDENTKRLESIQSGIQKRGSFARFVLGVNSKNAESAERVIESNAAEIQKLLETKATTEDTEIFAEIEAQVQSLTQQNEQAQKILDVAENKFSLLGWLKKIANVK